MKKFLLTLSAVAVTAGAWAQKPATEATPIPDSFVDVTPSYYKFYNGEADLNAMIREDITLPAPFNFGQSGSWITTNTGTGEGALFTPEQVSKGNFIFGAWVLNNHVPQEYKDAYTLYDLGETIGSALIVNYKNSELNQAIKDALELSEAPTLPKFDKVIPSGNPNLATFALLDNEAMNDYFLLANPGLDASLLPNIPEEIETTPVRIHIRLVLNAYNNDMTIPYSDALTFTYVQNEGNSVLGKDNSYVDLGMFAEDGNWSPYGWLVRDWEFDYKGIAAAVKFQVTGVQDYQNDGALLLRSIEAYVVPAGDENAMPNIEGKGYSETVDSWLDLTKGDITSGVEVIESVDVNAPVEYYNLQGVKVANPEKGIFVKKQGNKTSKVVVR